MKAQILKQDVKRRNNGETAVQFFTFEARHTDDEILEALDRAGIPIDGQGTNSAYDCSGRWFANSVHIHRRGKFRVVATQWWGLDI